MTTISLCIETAISVAELRNNIDAIIEQAGDSTVAITNHGRPTAYLVPAKTFEALIDKLEDLKSAAIVRRRRSGKTVKVSLNEL